MCQAPSSTDLDYPGSNQAKQQSYYSDTFSDDNKLDAENSTSINVL